jgi:hypothetical protein
MICHELEMADGVPHATNTYAESGPRCLESARAQQHQAARRTLEPVTRDGSLESRVGSQAFLMDGVVLLTPFQKDDAPTLMEWERDPEMARWFDFPARPPAAAHLDFAHHLVAKGHRDYESGVRIAWAELVRSTSENVCTSLGLESSPRSMDCSTVARPRENTP